MKRRVELITFFVIAIGFTWLFWIPDGLAKRGVLPNTLWWTNLVFTVRGDPCLPPYFSSPERMG